MLDKLSIPRRESNYRKGLFNYSAYSLIRYQMSNGVNDTGGSTNNQDPEVTVCPVASTPREEPIKSAEAPQTKSFDQRHVDNINR